MSAMDRFGRAFGDMALGAWLVTALMGRATAVMVRTKLGDVEGLRIAHGLNTFTGVPYAEPPQRFEAAAPKTSWNGTLDGTRFRDACMGNHPVEGLFNVSEDCLYVNIWASLQPELVPVVVFIHGGGFMFGSGNGASHWGDRFAASEEFPVVYVAINYRLGIFGFYSSDDTETNFGFRDQQLALRWVQDNVVAFGGDPDRVTLAGQSAGAMSVYAHLAAPASRGLFARAVLASVVGLHYRTEDENSPFVAALAKAVGCERWRRRTECLRAKPALALERAQVAPRLLHFETPCEGCDNFLPWVPVVDGDTLPGPPLDIIRSGAHNAVPVLMTNVRNESSAFIPDKLATIFSLPLGYQLAMHLLFNSFTGEVERHYAEATDTAKERRKDQLSVAVSDALFVCYTRYSARQLVKHAPVYLSIFMHAPSAHADPSNAKVNSDCESGATCHSADLAFMFPQSLRMRAVTKLRYSQHEETLVAAYSEAMLAFAHGHGSVWIPFDSTEASVLWRSDGPNHSMGYRRDHCDFFEEIGFTDGPWVHQQPVLSAPLVV